MTTLINCHGLPDSVLIDRADCWAVLPSAARSDAGGALANRRALVRAQRQRRVEERARARWIPLTPETRRMLLDARLESGLTRHALDARLAQQNGFVWDVEHGFHGSIDPDVFGLWLDCCQGTGEEGVAA